MSMTNRLEQSSSCGFIGETGGGLISLRLPVVFGNSIASLGG